MTRMKQIKAFCIILLLLATVFTVSSAMAEKTITLTFTGDCTIGSEEATRLNDDSFDTLAKAKGYDYFFANYRSLFEQDDLTVINFEGVLSDSKTQESRIKRYRFRGPTEFVKILTGSSIEACSLANNHTADFGTQGTESTRAALEENGIAWFQQYHYYMYEKDGIKIAFVSLHNIWNEFEKVKALLLDLKDRDVSGKDLEKRLDEVGITTNKNTVPGETRSPFVTSGVRLGTPAVTTRGFREDDMDVVAECIALMADDEANADQVRAKVQELTARYPLS